MRALVSTDVSRKIDFEAQNQWGFNTHALIEAAGRNCARAFEKAFPDFFANKIPGVLVFAGPGNNGADALSMLRFWLLEGRAIPESSKVIMSRFPDPDSGSPSACLHASLKKMQVSFIEWNKSLADKPLFSGGDMCFDIIIDGIAGTGLTSALTGSLREMTETINAQTAITGISNQQPPIKKPPIVVSVDLPSGLYDNWVQGESIVKADCTLAIEPLKHCLYKPLSRALAGIILPVGGLFPRALIYSHEKSELIDWHDAQKHIPCMRPDIHKYHRGTIRIYAGSQGSAGAAMIAARGAQAAGSGLVNLIVDNQIYPIAASGLASKNAGIMVSTAEAPDQDAPDKALEKDGDQGPRPKRFVPDSLLLGPGWGRASNRMAILQKALELEKTGTPLILDADGIFLARDFIFSGNTLLTPHIGEFAVFSGLTVKEIENNPVPILLETAAKKNACILLKSHVMYIASPDSRWGTVDGMVPGLACGGSGDLLAGFCASLAGRMAKNGSCDLYTCAAAAAALLTEAGRSADLAARFFDPMEAADRAADLAGKAWQARLGQGRLDLSGALF